MFTGIVKGVCPIAEVHAMPERTHFSVTLDKPLLSHLQNGASIAIDGTCLTVVKFNDTTVWFDAIPETLTRTTLQFIRPKTLVNVERSACIGDEIGGHLLSGHIFGMAKIDHIDRSNNSFVVWLKCDPEWTKYLFPKGYVALNGVSLTLVDVDCQKGLFSVHLIPETLKRTTFGHSRKGDWVNLELDSQAQAIVDTLARMKVSYTSKSTS